MLVKKSMDGIPCDPNLDMHSISDMLKGYNGADIMAVVKDVKVAALQRSKELRQRGEDGLSLIVFDDFVEAIKNHKSSVKSSDVEKLRKYAADMDISLPDEM